MIYEIVITNKSHYFVQTNIIDNQAYQFEFSFNSRDERWRLSVLNMKDNYLIRNIKILPFVGMVKRYKIENLFAGEIVGFNNKNIFEYPSFENLGNEFKIYYFSTEAIDKIKRGELWNNI